MASRKISQNRGDLLFDIINLVLLLLTTLCVIYPLIYILSASFSDPADVINGNIWLLPKKFNIISYKMVFREPDIMYGYLNTILYTSAGILLNTVMTICAAFPLSRRDLAGRRFFTAMFVLTMFFSGGLIPTYLLIKQLGMLDTFWVMIIPNAVSMWNIILMRTFFQSSIPYELQEAAFVDGCRNTGILLRIILPLSKPIIAVMVLFYGVAHWNAFFNALIYLSNRSRYPLQLILREILIQNQMSDNAFADIDSLALKQMIAESIKYALIIVASVPVLMLYPFLQKYFVKGVMVGSVKG